MEGGLFYCYTASPTLRRISKNIGISWNNTYPKPAFIIMSHAFSELLNMKKKQAPVIITDAIGKLKATII